MEALYGSYEPLLVIISICVAIAASFVALTTTSRIHSSMNTKQNLVWAIIFGSTLGTGIWSMHFIGMLAFQLPIPIYYDLNQTIVSLVLAIGVCSIAGIYFMIGTNNTPTETIFLGVLMGLSVTGMHYTGMAAMRMQANQDYSVAIVLLSIAIAIVAATVALFIANQFKSSSIFSHIKGKLLAAIVMGLAVSSMHYTAMYGTTFHKTNQINDSTGYIDPHFLAAMVLVITLLILGGTLVAALLDEASFKSRQAERAARQRAEVHNALFLILNTSMGSRPLNEILEVILNTLLEIHWLTLKKKGAIFLADNETKTLQMIASKNLGDELLKKCANIKFGTCLCGKAAQEKEMVYKPCVDHEHTIQPEGMNPHGHFCVPIKDKGSVLGVINLYVKHGHDASELEHSFLESVSTATAGVIRRKQLEEKLKKMSFHDELTGLPNRTLLLDRLDNVINEARRLSHHISVLFLDLDGFKAINDSLGHQAGDALLIEVAHRLKSSTRDMDTVARIGGDEFVLILNHIDESKPNASSVAKKIIAKLTTPFLLDGKEVTIGCSIGIAAFPLDAKTAEHLLRMADESMYTVKHLGKNNFLHYSNEWSHMISMSNPAIDQEHSLLIEKLNLLQNYIIESNRDKKTVMIMLKDIINGNPPEK